MLKEEDIYKLAFFMEDKVSTLSSEQQDFFKMCLGEPQYINWVFLWQDFSFQLNKKLGYTYFSENVFSNYSAHGKTYNKKTQMLAEIIRRTYALQNDLSTAVNLSEYFYTPRLITR